MIAMRTFTAVTTILLALSAGATVHADDDKKVTICHAAGQEGTTHYETLTISENAVFKDQGGHFYENGTSQAGHEQDYLGPCNVPDTTSPTTTTVAGTTVPESSTTSTDAPTTTAPLTTSTSLTTESTPPSSEPTTISPTPTVEVGIPPVVPNTEATVQPLQTAITTKKSLPETGNNLTLALIAFVLVGLGGGVTLLARRK